MSEKNDVRDQIDDAVKQSLDELKTSTKLDDVEKQMLEKALKTLAKSTYDLTMTNDEEEKTRCLEMINSAMGVAKSIKGIELYRTENAMLRIVGIVIKIMATALVSGAIAGALGSMTGGAGLLTILKSMKPSE